MVADPSVAALIHALTARLPPLEAFSSGSSAEGEN